MDPKKQPFPEPNIPAKFLKPYDPKATEDKIYEAWLSSGYFNPDKLPERHKDPFSIVLPPPNVTGTLHLGHALTLAIEDILVRYKRMKGFKTLWLPGTDHAAIATQSKVEGIIYKEEGKRRHDIGREGLVRRIETFAKESHDTIVKQVKKMGASVDWSREAYTLDEKRSLAVRTAFKQMYDEKLIYRGNRVINWDPKGQTTISDDEIVYVEGKGKLYTFKYSKDFPISIATTRPETKVGDTAVAVHPGDARYTEFIGKEYDIDFAGEKIHIKIVADEAVEPEFGTGAVGVTPAHSHTDYEIAQRHNLPLVPVINEFAKMSVTSPLLAGKKAGEAREAVVAWLKENNLLEKEEDIAQNIATAERTGGIVEPLPKLQWFIDVNKKIPSRGNKSLKELMLETVSENQIAFIPDRFAKIYTNWISNLRDWCISRQIWFGHRVPVWYKTEIGTEKEAFHFKKEILFKKLNFKNDAEFNRFSDDLLLDKKEDISWASNKEDEIQLHVKYIVVLRDRGYLSEDWIKENRIKRILRESEIAVGEKPSDMFGWVQDEDTLDTWFSAGLWTFSTLGWPEKTKDLELYHPTSLIETGYDIIFFWIARMILMSKYFLGEVPFKTAYLHGIVRNADGSKMSKSKGAIDPLEMCEKYGTDAVRMSLVIGSGPGNDMRMSEDKIRAYKNFSNKLWNITRFVLSSTEGEKIEKDFSAFSADDKKLESECDAILAEITKEMDEYKIHLAGEKLYAYAWHEFADIILEASKKILAEGTDADKKSRKQFLLHTLEKLLKALHPFMPFVTEEIWSDMPFANAADKKPLIIETWPM